MTEEECKILKSCFKKKMDKFRVQMIFEKSQKRSGSIKLNFAHFGGELESAKWQRKIVELIKTYPNVYVDISYVCTNKNSYKLLNKMLNTLCKTPGELDRVKSRLLFGSDFSVNLFDITFSFNLDYNHSINRYFICYLFVFHYKSVEL